MATPPVEIGFGIVFEVPGVSGEYQYELKFLQKAHPQNATLQGEKLVLAGKTLFHQELGKWVRAPAVVPQPQAGQLALGSITGIQEIAIAYVLLSTGLGFYCFGEDVLLQQGPGGGQQPPGFSDYGDNYLNAFTAIVNNLHALQYWKEIVASLRHLNSSVKSVELAAPDRSRIVVGHDAGGKSLVLDLSQESEGFRRFLAHLIALYQSPPKQLLVFEQPEKGIHPGALASLAEEFKACSDSDRGQVILTTHSPDLLDHFEPANVRLVEMENCATRIGPVSPEQVETIREQLLQTGDLLTIDPARPAVASPA